MDGDDMFLMGAGAFCLVVGFFFGGLAMSDGPKIKEMKAQYTELQTKYQNSICSHRGLEITTVEGIKLCMDPATKALHKIDSKAD